MSKALPLAVALVCLSVLFPVEATMEFDSLAVDLSVEVTDPPLLIGIPGTVAYPQVDVEFAAHIGVLNALDPLTDDIVVQIANFHIFEIGIPAGCLARQGSRFMLPDWQRCGVSLRVLHPYLDTFDDLTSGIKVFHVSLRRLPDLPGWHLGIHANFNDIRNGDGEVGFAPLLGAAEHTSVAFDNHYGHTYPKKIHAVYPPNFGTRRASE